MSHSRIHSRQDRAGSHNNKVTISVLFNMVLIVSTLPCHSACLENSRVIWSIAHPKGLKIHLFFIIVFCIWMQSGGYCESLNPLWKEARILYTVERWQVSTIRTLPQDGHEWFACSRKKTQITTSCCHLHSSGQGRTSVGVTRVRLCFSQRKHTNRNSLYYTALQSSPVAPLLYILLWFQSRSPILSVLPFCLCFHLFVLLLTDDRGCPATHCGIVSPGNARNNN